MPARECAQCGRYLDKSCFSRNQWCKGGNARCETCVEGQTQCPTCSRTFGNEHSLRQHMQTHQERNVCCPICGEQRFRSTTNAIQHIETGTCSGCRGADNARNQIYDWMQSNGAPILTGRKMIEYGGSGSTPDNAYQCQCCAKTFRQCSQLMQHMRDKHGRDDRVLASQPRFLQLGYY
jgi:hypothetical protein